MDTDLFYHEEHEGHEGGKLIDEGRWTKDEGLLRKKGVEGFGGENV